MLFVFSEHQVNVDKTTQKRFERSNERMTGESVVVLQFLSVPFCTSGFILVTNTTFMVLGVISKFDAHFLLGNYRVNSTAEN